MATLLFFSVLPGCIAGSSVFGAKAVPSPPAFVGVWSSYPRALPSLQLPQVPLTGNGAIGAALDAHNSVTPPDALGPGSSNSLDVWVNSNGFWSCTSCRGTDPDNTVPACCSTAAFGGVSFRVTPTFPGSSPLPRFSATQALANGALAATLSTASGGEFALTLRVHPRDRLLVANFSWAPAPNDPPSVEVEAAVWVLGKGAIEGSWDTGLPAPWGAGCLSLRTGARQPCGGPEQAVFASRNASTVNATVMPVSAALVMGLSAGPGATILGYAVGNDAPVHPPTLPFEARARISVPGGSWGLAAFAQAETRGPGLGDPVPLAWATLADGRGGAGVADASDAWWAATWAKSAVALPAQPAVEASWFGAQYVLAATSATTSSDDLPAPGLYGVWVTADGPNWHGDYTLDYNFAAPYYGVFSSNRPEQAEAYWRPISAWLPPAQKKAQVQAALARVACPGEAAYYDCHIAPWGLASIDPMLRYMTWNGPHAVLAFINHFEYTRNATFAREKTYPLLSALNAWWLCYLNKTAAGLWNDNNAFNPDFEHEGQRVPNPQIAMAFISRTAGAQLDLARRLALAPPPALLDLAAHLAPFNAIVLNASLPANASSFVVLNNTRCKNDIQTWYDVPSVAACEAACLSNPSCGVFSYCPPTGVNNATGCTGGAGTPQPLTCWAFPLSQLPNCVSNPASRGWTSGWLNATRRAVELPVWTAFAGARLLDSDWFASYPSWPAEAVDPGSPFAADGGATRRAAQAASVLYGADMAGGRPVDLFEMAVRAGANASGLAWSAPQVLAGFNAWLARFQGPTFLPGAPGGGVENTGVSRAVNDMLLQAHAVPADMEAALGSYVLELFPFVDPAAPAEFTTLLAKGGFLVSAAYDNATRAVASPVAVSAAYTLQGSTGSRCSVVVPAGWARDGVTVACGGAQPAPAPAAALPDGRSAVAFDAPAGEVCLLAAA
jgi:hypothetical protein